MSNVGIIKPWDTLTPSTKYAFWLPVVHQDQTGDVIDRSGNSANGAQGANVVDGTMWGTTGWARTVESANEQSFSVPAAKFTWDMADGDSMLLSFRIKDVTGTIDGLVGNYSAGSQAGVRILIDIAAQSRPVVTDGTNTAAVSVEVGPDLSDGSEHHMVLAVDGQTKKMYMWGNNTALSLDGSTDFDVSAVTGSTESTRDFMFGGDSNTADTVEAKFRDIHALVFPAAGLPSNINQLVKLLNSRPFYPLLDTDISA